MARSRFRIRKRRRRCAEALEWLLGVFASQSPGSQDNLLLVDSTPVPCGQSRETARRSELAGDAAYGWCRSHSRYFWGFRLYLVCTPEGMPVIWGLANPKIGEREVTQALLARARAIEAGSPANVGGTTTSIQRW